MAEALPAFQKNKDWLMDVASFCVSPKIITWGWALRLINAMDLSRTRKCNGFPKRGVGLLAAIAGLSASAAIHAGIVGSAHDFSAFGWSNGEICTVCHTPHNATNADIAPLWGHTLSTASYQVYQSVYSAPRDTIFAQGAIHPPGPESLVCLSCHDGTVALDSFGGNVGSSYISGTGLIGTDLRDDHPIGVEWTHQVVWENTTANCTKCHIDIPMPFDKMPLPFFKSTGAARMECSTCHDPHNGDSNEMLLRKTNAGSSLCLHCHDQ
ncbi:cytochrome c3 family protein [Thiolapillus sp.]